MSRDGYERWDDQPDARESGRHNSRGGRRARRSAAQEDSWPGDSSAGQGSGERPAPQTSGGPPWQPGGYDPAAYTDPAGYPDSPRYPDPGGYPDPRGYPDQGGYPGSRGYEAPGGYGDSGGYPAPRSGYPDSGSHPGSSSYPGFDPGAGQYYESGGRSSGALPAGGAGSGSDGYRENGYSENGYSGSPYRDSGGHSSSLDSGYQRGDGGSYGNGQPYGDRGYSGGGYGENGYGDQAYNDRGYGDAGYPGAGHQADEYSVGGRDPYGGTDPYRTNPSGRPDSGGRTDPGRQAGRREQDYGVSDSYGASGRYGRQDQYGADDQYGAHDQYGESAGYGASDSYPAQDAYGQPGAGRGAAGYDASAGYEHGGGYDDEYGSAAGARGLGGAGGRGAPDDDDYGWPGSVDDSGITSRRGRDSEDEIDADSARHNGFFRGFGRGDDDYGHRPPKRRRSRAPIVALTVVIIFLVAVAGGGVYAYHWYSKRHADWVGSKGYGSVTVQVKPGEIACSLALENTMVSEGVVASGTAFCDAAKTAGTSASLEPGSFRLKKHMGALLAWNLLVSPKSRLQQTVAVPDGLRASKILAILAKGTGISLTKFQAAFKDTSALGLPSWAHGSAEGFLYPATYPIQPGTSAADILKMMVSKFNSEVASLNLAAEARRVGFTELHVITEASLLEGEVGSVPKYFPDVARVIDNRLNQVPPMKLQLDSTVAYATGHYIYNLSQSDQNVKSPYNTFKHSGLPPGPIDSPDAAAIQAVLHPNDSQNARTWLYFVTVNKAGKTDFTASYSTFLTWSAEAQKALG
ncbi:MAG TPA: endolytic transglycosylase MltG [Streptosporangiaceae bacterium]|nr:endolytic transglycosylase MltG [Streptosporangiaceae bacterium]